MKPASPNLVVGLSCFSPMAKSVQSLVDKYFSPLPSPEKESLYKDGADKSGPDASHGSSTSRASGTDASNGRGASRAPSQHDPFSLLLYAIEETISDAGLQEIPRNCAIFLVMDEAQGFPYSLATEINEHYLARGLDVTVMLSNHSEPSLQEALNWLERGECELALVAAIDRLSDSKSAYGSAVVAAILLSRSNAAAEMKLRAYAGVQQENWLNTDPRSVSLLEVFTERWYQNQEACKSWEALREEARNQFTGADASPGQAKDQVNDIWPHHDEICYFSSLSAELSAGAEKIRPLMSVICSALAHHLRVIPASGADEHSIQLNNNRISLQSKSARPWIHPISPIEPAHPRRSFLDLNSFGLLMNEHGSDLTDHSSNLIQKQSSELFAFDADSVEELKHELHQFLLNLHQDVPMHELAFNCNCNKQAAEPCKYRLAIVAVNHNELQRLLNDALTHLNTEPAAPLSPPPTRAIGIYYSGNKELPGTKLAFVLPGLGAAYPQMLQDLCFYFPEVRHVFDFVERLALRAGDKVVPSRAIFPVAGSKIYPSSQAMLATMDSAVITLLLAEWAIYALLKNLEINPDVLLGCSTGEFAAMTMGEAIDILKAAQTFYHLSTGVSRSVSLNELSELRTIRVSASFDEDIAPLLAQVKGTVYLGADLSQTCALLSGERNAIEDLCKLLKEKDIEFLTLPVAIPYHTPLVAGKVSDKDEDVQKLEMKAAKTESWSCSTADRLPDDSEKLRKISTDLFEKPIRLRSTIKRLYETGVGIFVELGPKGGLVSYISEILKDKQHVAVAANVQNKSGIDQLNAMLAILSCSGVKMNLRALYERRIVLRSSSSQSSESSQLNLQLRIDEQKTVSFDAEKQNTSLQLSDSIYEFMQWSQLSDDQQDLGFLGSDFGVPSAFNDEVMINYLSTMQQMHSSLLDSQEMMMLAYLQSLETEDPNLSDLADTGLAFLQKPAVRDIGDCFRLDFTSSTQEHLFLLDHAIGGETSEVIEQSRVYLLPLMVALEIMAEGAQILYPHLQVCRMLDIRAYRRIKVGRQALSLYLELRAHEENHVDVSICMDDTDKDERIVLASCKVELSFQLPHGARQLELPVSEPRKSKFSNPKSLYGTGAMFHGKRMQSVESIDLVSKRSISGKLACRASEGWFKQGMNRRLLIDPLLLDNASQFVLYQMFEHDYPVSALLPFHIESIEFFEGYHEQENKTLSSNAILRSISLRGTEANLELLDADGNVLAKINEISSRAIVLPELMRKFIEDPRTLLCEQIKIDELPRAAITTISKQEIPEDETTLDWLTDYILSDLEQAEWRNVGKTDKRRYDWLSGRIAVKDAVRILLERELGIEVKFADICIANTESGAARVSIPGVNLPWLPQISISHSRNMAVAIAEPPNPARNAGIDIEEIIEREEGFAKLAFTEQEFFWISQANVEERARRIATLWTSKEAAAKAHGSGFGSHLKHFELKEENGKLFFISAKLESMEQSKLYKCSVREIAPANSILAIVYSCDTERLP